MAQFQLMNIFDKKSHRLDDTAHINEYALYIYCRDNNFSAIQAKSRAAFNREYHEYKLDDFKPHIYQKVINLDLAKEIKCIVCPIEVLEHKLNCMGNNKREIKEEILVYKITFPIYGKTYDYEEILVLPESIEEILGAEVFKKLSDTEMAKYKLQLANKEKS